MNDLPNIESLFPKCLDEIIKLNRDKYSLRLATDYDLDELQNMVDVMANPKPVRKMIDDWRMICLVSDEGAGGQDSQGKQLFLTGSTEGGHPYMTSTVRAVDLQNKLLLTNNSLYRLGNKGNGEPDLYILLHICHVFNKWGWGQTLGALPVFY